jgi:hypothetical protein
MSDAPRRESFPLARKLLRFAGRDRRGIAAKHAIKRVWQFGDNDGVQPTDANAGVNRRLLRKRK